MEFPGFITGPQFCDGDIVTFVFEDAELTLRLPVVAYDTDSIDEVGAVRDFTGAETWRWDECAGNRQKEIVLQSWKYEDDVTHDDIASVYMSVCVISHKDIDERGLYLLNSNDFESYWLQELADDYLDTPETRDGWPSAINSFFCKTIDKPVLDGIQVQVDLGAGAKYPVPTAYFSLGRRFSLRISFSFCSLHYSDRKNPYSDDLLHDWKADLFNDFLSYISIEYTPETVAMIKEIAKARQASHA